MNQDSEDASKLVGLLRNRALRLAEELTIADEVHDKADDEGKLLVEIAALQAAREAMQFLLVLVDKHRDGAVKTPLENLEKRLLARTRGAPGLSLRERHLRWWTVEAVQVLVASQAMGLNDARKYVCKHLKKHGFTRKRKARGQQLVDITPATIKGWERAAGSKDSRPKATPQQGREFADRILNHVIPALKDSEE